MVMQFRDFVTKAKDCKTKEQLCTYWCLTEQNWSTWLQPTWWYPGSQLGKAGKNSITTSWKSFLVFTA